MDIQSITNSELSKEMSCACFDEMNGILLLKGGMQEELFSLTFKEGANLLLALKEFYGKFGVE